jgi:hypothetical protein
MRVPRYWWLAVLVGLVVAGVLFLGRALSPPPQVSTNQPALSSGIVGPTVERREARPTLDPALFVGKASLAHQVAREIPDVLDQLYCYCECDKHLGHRSLLSCYTDGHAAT